jgi:hypothetical protein
MAIPLPGELPTRSALVGQGFGSACAVAEVRAPAVAEVLAPVVAEVLAAVVLGAASADSDAWHPQAVASTAAVRTRPASTEAFISTS